MELRLGSSACHGRLLGSPALPCRAAGAPPLSPSCASTVSSMASSSPAVTFPVAGRRPPLPLCAGGTRSLVLRRREKAYGCYWNHWIFEVRETRLDGRVTDRVAHCSASLPYITAAFLYPIFHCICLGKGMQSMTADSLLKKGKDTTDNTWVLPEAGWVKINVDGSFQEQTVVIYSRRYIHPNAGAGVVARDSNGKVCFTAWRVLFRCANALEAEVHAFVEGLRLAGQWCDLPVVLESDSAQMVEVLQRKKEDRSETPFITREAKELAQSLAGGLEGQKGEERRKQSCK